MFLPPFSKGVYTKRKESVPSLERIPFHKKLCVRERNHEVIKIISLVQMVENLMYPGPSPSPAPPSLYNENTPI